MKIFALDLAVRSGFALGEPGSVPRSGAVVLKRPHEARSVALGNLVYFVDAEWRKSRPDLVVAEAPMNLEAYRARRNSQDRVRMDYGLHGVLEAMCSRHGLRLITVHVSTVRKHLLGYGRARDDDERIKESVVQRCQLIGLMPRTSNDEDRADAVAIWEYACATYGQRSATMTELFLIGEKPR